MAGVHDFEEKLNEGERYERFLDEFFRRRNVVITKATQRLQKAGVDRIFERNGVCWKIDYKADTVAARTGNAFIETISVDSPADDVSIGWAAKSQADAIYYYIPPQGRIIVVKMETIRAMLPYWIEAYPHGKAQNRQYRTHGVLVPLTEIEKHADHIVLVS